MSEYFIAYSVRAFSSTLPDFRYYACKVDFRYSRRRTQQDVCRGIIDQADCFASSLIYAPY